MVDDDKCEAALSYLADTDARCAHLKANVARAEYAARLARAREFILADAGSVEHRKSLSEQSEAVQAAESRVADAIEAYEKIRARRTTAELIVEVWRSVQANRRAGNI